MPEITFIAESGPHVVEVPVGESTMKPAVSANVPGILGECGGVCACATCHVYVDKDWIDRVGQGDEMETEMLELAVDPTPYSRLCCQIIASEDLDGLILRVPERQK